ncbi:MAG TPA: hypothetical protein DIT67_12380 [Octadecabacter sp.]|nr:hypothetical protein [Octadecabacter sp.]
MLKAAQSTEQAIYFSGLEAPVLLKNAGALVPVLKQALPSWSFAQTRDAPPSSPCMTVTGHGDGTFLCQTRDPETNKARRWDAVNAVCEMIVALAWEQIQSNPEWLCLHCAAIEFNGRLVLFPNRRRSGKSTLTAVLAQRGFTVFSDDFVPIKIGDDGLMYGVANEVNPRLRLPVAETFTAEFKSWVADSMAASNDQYAYLGIDTLAPRGTYLPIGAVVVLDRQDTACDTALHAVHPMEILDDLITQNFGRMAHSGRILAASNGVAQTARGHRLRYHAAEDAAVYLEDQFRDWSTPVARVVDAVLGQEPTADLQITETEPALFDPCATYTRAAGVSEVSMEDQLYVADGHGVGIQKMNAGSNLIWRILEDPMSLGDISDLLSAAFPNHPPAEITSDSAKTLQQLLHNHLIVPVPPSEGQLG